MNDAQHHAAKAEEYLLEANRSGDMDFTMYYVARAQAHATLAQVSATMCVAAELVNLQ